MGVDAVGGADVAGTGIASAAHAPMTDKTRLMRVMDRTNRRQPGLLTTDRMPLAKPKMKVRFHKSPDTIRAKPKAPALREATVNGGGGGAVAVVGAASDLERRRASRWRKPEALAISQRLQKLWTQ